MRKPAVPYPSFAAGFGYLLAASTLTYTMLFDSFFVGRCCFRRAWISLGEVTAGTTS